MPPWLLNFLYIPAALLYLPILVYQMVVLGKNRSGWKQRFAGFPHREGPPCIWLHAVSLGEVNATRSLVKEIAARLPDHDIVITSTTDTGFAAARRLYPDRMVVRFPLDFSFVIRRAINRIRPAAIILMELEVWPNLVRIATKDGIPVGIANGRITEEKSMRRFNLPGIRGLARDMFSRLAWTAAQSRDYADRFIKLGTQPDRVSITGSLKFDTAEIGERINGDAALAEAMGLRRDAKLVTAGSTGPGEEKMILTAYADLLKQMPDLQLALIPRKPERFDEAANLVNASGFACRRRSSLPDGGSHPPDSSTRPVFLGDTMGELRKFYALADAVFVGRTLVPLGGSDLMEPAALAKPICFGPHVENFSDVADQLTQADAAVRLAGEQDLGPALIRLIGDPEADAIGRRAQEVVRRNMGATGKTIDLLCNSLGLEVERSA